MQFSRPRCIWRHFFPITTASLMIRCSLCGMKNGVPSTAFTSELHISTEAFQLDGCVMPPWGCDPGRFHKASGGPGIVPMGTEEPADTGPGRTRCWESSRWHTLLCIGTEARVRRGSSTLCQGCLRSGKMLGQRAAAFAVVH